MLLRKIDSWMTWLEQGGHKRLARQKWVALQVWVAAMLMELWMRVPMLREQYEQQNAVIDQLKRDANKQESQIERLAILLDKAAVAIDMKNNQLLALSSKQKDDAALMSKLVQTMNDHARDTRQPAPSPMDGAARDVPVGSGCDES